MSSQINKICKKCNESKPLDDYYKHSKTIDKKQQYCKKCAKKIAHQYNQSERGREKRKYYRDKKQKKINICEFIMMIKMCDKIIESSNEPEDKKLWCNISKELLNCIILML